MQIQEVTLYGEKRGRKLSLVKCMKLKLASDLHETNTTFPTCRGQHSCRPQRNMTHSQIPWEYQEKIMAVLSLSSLKSFRCPRGGCDWELRPDCPAACIEP